MEYDSTQVLKIKKKTYILGLITRCVADCTSILTFLNFTGLEP